MSESERRATDEKYKTAAGVTERLCCGVSSVQLHRSKLKPQLKTVTNHLAPSRWLYFNHCCRYQLLECAMQFCNSITDLKVPVAFVSSSPWLELMYAYKNGNVPTLDDTTYLSSCMACELECAMPSDLKSTLPIIPTCNPPILLAGKDVEDSSYYEGNAFLFSAVDTRRYGLS